MPEPDTDTLRQTVLDWLLDEGWTVSEQEHEDAVWLLDARDSGQRRLVIGLSRKPADQLRIQAGVKFTPAQQQQFAALQGELRSRIIWELRFRLLAMNVDFQGLGDPLEQVALSQRIYLDGLTKDAFLQRISQVKNSLLTVIWSVVRYAEGTVGSAPEPRVH